MTMFRAAQVASPRGQLALVDRSLADPGPGTVRVAVEACGICHSDSLFVDDQWPSVRFPVTPGHEIAGHIDAIGDGVAGWREGERVSSSTPGPQRWFAGTRCAPVVVDYPTAGPKWRTAPTHDDEHDGTE